MRSTTRTTETRSFAARPCASKIAALPACTRGHSLNIFPLAHLALLACVLASLAACGTTRSVTRELDAEQARLATANFTLSSHDKDAPNAEITPQGDFLVAGKPVTLTSQQHAQTLSYRAQLMQVNEQAFIVAKHGVKMGMRGTAPLMRGTAPLVFRVLPGESDEEIDQYMHKRLSGVFAEAAKICDRLPAVMTTERQLATSLSAFKPYANLTPAKIDDCRNDPLDGGDVEQYGVG